MDDASLNTGSYPTRTVAIIKPHALPHRLDIERRITEAGFEIAKERQMMFHENDRDVEDLFGAQDATSLAEDPVWVYVLERRRAVEVLRTLMGDEDPEIARQSNPNSLRALYGTSMHDNAVIGSPDSATAEHQISVLFASSPPFRAMELPDSLSFAGRTGSLRSITSSVLSELNRENGGESYEPRSSLSPISGKETSTTGRSSKDTSTGRGFRARPVPASIAKPTIQPRTSRAAALRAGIVQPNVSVWSDGPRQALSKEEHRRTFANVPGHKRAETITVTSTAAPVIAPRMTKAAALRQGKVDISPSKPRVRDADSEKKIFDGVPGHRRRETLQVASVQAPIVAPRINRSAALRAEKDKPPPTSYMFRTGKTPTSTSTNSNSISERSNLSRPSVSRTTSLPNGRPASTSFSRAPTTANGSTPAIKRPSSAAGVAVPVSIGKPTIEPRQNKSALLRAKKLESTRDGTGKVNGRPVFV